jgi:hypothetical protein
MCVSVRVSSVGRLCANWERRAIGQDTWQSRHECRQSFGTRKGRLLRKLMNWYEQQCGPADGHELSHNTDRHTRTETPKAEQWKMGVNIDAVTVANQENAFHRQDLYDVDKVSLLRVMASTPVSLCTKVITGFPIQLCRAWNLLGRNHSNGFPVHLCTGCNTGCGGRGGERGRFLIEYTAAEPGRNLKRKEMLQFSCTSANYRTVTSLSGPAVGAEPARANDVPNLCNSTHDVFLLTN